MIALTNALLIIATQTAINWKHCFDISYSLFRLRYEILVVLNLSALLVNYVRGHGELYNQIHSLMEDAVPTFRLTSYLNKNIRDEEVGKGKSTFIVWYITYKKMGRRWRVTYVLTCMTLRQENPVVNL